tara:strand:+ start:4935 stop:5150 length:216 start_codon:yes stop_codon:yes gene_type:complete
LNESLINEQTFIFTCLCLSVFRIYLEVIRFDFAKLPLTKALPTPVQANFHKFGFYMAIGYFVLFAPEYLMA